ncbi:hypothetical protein LCGC14_1703220 [marine sediment metagenome]|uniref:Uncharacterized protein n=1 Tax=marine sediment metagenome TaxID=412755 RepID=A0A0F9HHW0_9ZZZZ
MKKKTKEIKAQPYTKKLRATVRGKGNRGHANYGRFSPIHAAVTSLKPGACVVVSSSFFDGSNNYPPLGVRERINGVSSVARRWVSGFTIKCRSCKDGSVVVFRADE